MSTFVSVGNAKQPFNRLIAAVAQIEESLPSPVFIQYGASDCASLGNCKGVAYLEMSEFEMKVAEAELLILHAGAGSLIHAVRAGRIPVVVPRRQEHGEHIDDHQVEFVRELQSSPRVVVCNEPNQLLSAVHVAQQRQNQLLSAEPISPPNLVRLIREILLDAEAIQ